MSKWIANSPYHWTGPAGWTICRVTLNGTEHFELWEGEARASGCCRFRGLSLAAAEDAYEKQTGDATNYLAQFEQWARSKET